MKLFDLSAACIGPGFNCVFMIALFYPVLDDDYLGGLGGLGGAGNCILIDGGFGGEGNRMTTEGGFGAAG